jgi:predicted negative regulator of RcsB-dependent stress response
MATTPATTEKTKFIDRMANFILKKRKILLFSAIIVLVSLIGVIVYVELKNHRAESSAAKIEKIMQEFTVWQDAKEEEKPVKEEAILKELDAVLSDYAGTYAAVRALFMKAEIAFEKKDFAAAAKTYTELSEKSPKSHLAPIALLNASAAYEEVSDSASALGALRKIEKTYLTSFPEMPRVLFGIARLSEGLSDFETSAKYYNRVIDEYGSSSWTKIARDRIIYLQTQKKIAEAF